MTTAQIIADFQKRLAAQYAPRPNTLKDTEDAARLRTGYALRQRYSGQRGRRVIKKALS